MPKRCADSVPDKLDLRFGLSLGRMHGVSSSDTTFRVSPGTVCGRGGDAWQQLQSAAHAGRLAGLAKQRGHRDRALLVAEDGIVLGGPVAAT